MVSVPIQPRPPKHTAPPAPSWSPIFSAGGKDDMLIHELCMLQSKRERLMDPRTRTSFNMFADFVKVDKNAVSWTSSYSYDVSYQYRCRIGPIKFHTVSNSSLKLLFSLAGSDAIRADRARKVAWSFFAWPDHRSY